MKRCPYSGVSMSGRWVSFITWFYHHSNYCWTHNLGYSTSWVQSFSYQCHISLTAVRCIPLADNIYTLTPCWAEHEWMNEWMNPCSANSIHCVAVQSDKNQVQNTNTAVCFLSPDGQTRWWMPAAPLPNMGFNPFFPFYLNEHQRTPCVGTTTGQFGMRMLC